MRAYQGEMPNVSQNGAPPPKPPNIRFTTAATAGIEKKLYIQGL
jgi:hypothetical protein